MRFGLSEKDFEILNKVVILPLKKAGLKVSVFGSRANGKFKKYSDIDICFEGNISDVELFKIKSEIEESDVSIKVDIVDFKDFPQTFVNNIVNEKIDL